MKLLRMLVVVGLVGLIGQTTAWADVMLPRYRFEDLGLASKYSSGGSDPVVWFLSDGTVASADSSIASEELRYRKGEYLRADVWSSQGRLEKFVLKKDGSDVNLMPDFDPNKMNFRSFSSNGYAIFYDSSGNGTSPQFIFNTSTGEKTWIPVYVGTDTYSLIGINGLNKMVGTGSVGGDTQALYYASIDSAALILRTLVDNPGQWVLRSAMDINDAGEIIGWGYDYSKPLDDGPRVFKLVPVAPVPEPSTWLILGVGSLWIFRKFRSSAK
jgi:hypothetical protein